LVGSPDSRGSVVQEDQEPGEESWSCGGRFAELDPVGERFFTLGWCLLVWKQGWMSMVASGGDRVRGDHFGFVAV
jgi:hypothetical protein